MCGVVAQRDERDAMPDRHWLLAQGFIDEAFSAKLGGMSQDHWEFSIMYHILGRFLKKPHRVLEIGVYGGWTLAAWMDLAGPDGVGLGIDANTEPISAVLPTPVSVMAMEADSHDRQTLQRVKKMFPGGVDLLFIDGDHSLRGCRDDFNMYAPLVAEGGAVGFHDILTGDVRATWREIVRRYPTVQVQNTAPDGSLMGIGFAFRLPHVGPFKPVVLEDD
jgi:hypothetical protein